MLSVGRPALAADPAVPGEHRVAGAAAQAGSGRLRFLAAYNPFPFSDFADGSAAFTASFHPGPWALYSLRILGESEAACEKCRDLPIGGKRLHDITEYGLLAGWSRDGAHYGLSASAGPGYDFGKQKVRDSIGGVEYREYGVVGAALDARATWRFRPAFGIGLQAFANLNPRQSIFGLMAALELRLF